MRNLINKTEMLMATSYLPPLVCFYRMQKCHTVIIEGMENYPKQSLRNRCFIASANGILCLSIPVKRKEKNFCLTKDIKIDYSSHWQKTHWRSIESAYNASPFFLHYRDFFEPFYIKKYHFLVDYNNKLLSMIFTKILKKQVDIKLSEQYVKTNNGINDFRYLCNNKTTAIQQDMENVKNMKPYKQVFEERLGFIPNLSVIDLLFNEGTFYY